MLAEGSQHKNGVDIYKSVGGSEILPMPDALVDYIIFLRNLNKPVVPTPTIVRDDSWLSEPIPHPGVYNRTLKFIGYLMQNKNIKDPQQLFALISLAYGKNGVINTVDGSPFDWDREKVQAMCDKAVTEWKTGEEKAIEAKVELTQKPPVIESVACAVVGVGTCERAQLEPPPEIKSIPYPVFPEWILHGTSIYDGLVKPICAVNDRIPYFQFMPAFAILINYLGTKVKIKYKDFKGCLYLGLVGSKTRAHKSTCIKDAMRYFKYQGILVESTSNIKLAESRCVSYSPGSTEGLGKDMQKHSCNNAVLVYDEMKTLAQKMGIEGSSMGGHLLLMYEAQTFANGTKSTKDKFCIEEGNYAVSILTACTKRTFPQHWSKILTGYDGMGVRWTFMLQPEKMPDRKVFRSVVFTNDSSLKTRQLIDKAVKQNEYAFDSERMLEEALNDKTKKLDGRDLDRAEKYALGFAVDLGLDSIDEDCLERALRLVEYEVAVRNYLRNPEAESREGLVQVKIMHLLQSHSGLMARHKVERLMNARRIGTIDWKRYYYGLVSAGCIREEGTGTKGDPIMVRLMQPLDDTDDEDDYGGEGD